MEKNKNAIIISIAAIVILGILFVTFFPKKEKVDELEEVDIEEVIDEEKSVRDSLMECDNYLDTLDKYEVEVIRDFVKVTRISNKLNEAVVMPILRVEYKDNIFDLQVGYELWYSMPRVGIVVADMDVIRINTLEYIVGIHPSPDYEELLQK